MHHDHPGISAAGDELQEGRPQVIEGCCDSYLFLGSNSISRAEHIAKLLGNETINTTTHGYSFGGHGNDSFRPTLFFSSNYTSFWTKNIPYKGLLGYLFFTYFLMLFTFASSADSFPLRFRPYRLFFSVSFLCIMSIAKPTSRKNQ